MSEVATATPRTRKPKIDVVVVKVPGTTRTVTKVVTTTAAGAKTVVTVPTKSALVSPAKKYYGLAEDGLPGSQTLFSSLDEKAGKAPNLVEWFEYWDDSYSPQKVTQSWQRGALPVITWQSAPHDYANSHRDISGYSMQNIARGTFDRYLSSFATSVVNTKLPVVIRLDQEMNGNWYPWSAGYSDRGITNDPRYFRAAWQHIWQVFDRAGANKYVIWGWTPSRTDTLKPGSTTGFTNGDTGLVEDYPGDRYVDWLGMSGYQFRPSQPATYDYTFDGTLNGNTADVGLKSVSRTKPILIAEMGSAQVVGEDTDNTAAKTAWTTQTLAAVADDPRLVGFVLFNNDVKRLHSIRLTDGTHLSVDTNWQFASSAPALAAFRQGIADPRFGNGLMPAQLKGTVTLKGQS
ncbi:glycoside hydrolase family 26 protein [Angustibacter sp. McL0619]|uniref:glycoside hydrolase family 26 protein n=1 Tax=Angustibacter sp. McL0619 TaxID=3415676 RepID=UPI003CEABCD4